MGEVELRAGGYGFILVIVTSIFHSLGYFLSDWIYAATGSMNEHLYYQIFSVFFIIAYSIFFIFGMLLLKSTRKAAHRFEGSKAGKVGAILAMVVALVLILDGIFYISGISLEFWSPNSEIYAWPNIIDEALWLLSYGLFGATMIVTAVFFMIYQRHFSHREVWILAGILFLITGIIEFQWYIHWFIWFGPFFPYYLIFLSEQVAMAAAGAVGAFCFLRTKSVSTQNAAK